MREGQPSLTARKVALNTVMIGSMPDLAHILPAGAASASERVLRASGVASASTLALARWRRMGPLLQNLDGLMPGQLAGFARRKRFFEEHTVAAIDRGATQVLVLGAGYDTLAWRLAARFPRVQFVEIDHPATASRKQRAIRELGKPDNLRLVAEDLAQRRLDDVLRALEGWDVAADSVVIAEGLLMYLPEDAVRSVFERVASTTGPESRVLCSYVGRGADGRPDPGPFPRLVRASLRIIGEPWLWGIAPDDLDAFLAPLGWHRVGPASAAEARAGIEHLADVAKLSARPS